MANWVDLVQQNNQNSSPQSLASAGYTTAQTQGQDLQNQQAAARLSILKQYMATHPIGGAPQGQPDPNAQQDGAAAPGNAAPGQFDLSNEHLDQMRMHARQQFAPVPNIPTPQTVQGIRDLNTLEMAGIPTTGMRENLTTAQNMQIQGTNEARSKAARDAYTKAYTVSQASDDDMDSVLRGIKDPEIQKLADLYEQHKVDPDTIRDHASKVAGMVYQESGLPVDMSQKDFPRDERGKIIPGFGNELGLSAEQRSKILDKAAEMVTTYDRAGQELKIPGYKYYFGAPNALSAVQAASTAIRAGGKIPGVNAPESSQGAAPSAQAPGRGGAPAAPAARQPTGSIADPNTPNGKLDLKNFDKSPYVNDISQRAPSSMADDEKKYRDQVREADAGRQKDLTSATTLVKNSDRILQLAQKATVGPGSELVGQAQKVFHMVTGRDLGTALGDPGLRDELTKLLGADAIAGLQREMSDNGLAARMGAQTDKLAIEKLNANPEMLRHTILDLATMVKNNAQYDVNKYGKSWDSAFHNNVNMLKYGAQYDTAVPRTDYMQRVSPPLPTGGSDKASTAAAPPTVKSRAEMNALPNTVPTFLTPDGRHLKNPNYKAQ